MNTTTVTPRSGRELISDEFADVVATVLDNNPGMTRGVAERVVSQAVAFVATAASGTIGIAPSRVVDEGWHALVLDTRLYARLCGRLGAFVHHQPERPGAAGYHPDWLTHTMAEIRSAGFDVDDELWLAPGDSSIAVAAPAQHTPNGPNCAPIVTVPKPKPKGTPQPVPVDTV
ncbi:glycine-rich domain-containing protein [Streptomyces xiamenensis]|uniref:glycine-rich domain-containing protein n=1 Tax=Streptomyces xiamenensis TaxID=408015 RepID=UPI00369AF406